MVRSSLCRAARCCSRASLRALLDEFLKLDRDRVLFNLKPRPKLPAPSSGPSGSLGWAGREVDGPESAPGRVCGSWGGILTGRHPYWRRGALYGGPLAVEGGGGEPATSVPF